MTRAATDDNEDYLLMIARHGTASHMEQLVREYQTVAPRVVPHATPKADVSPQQARKLMTFQDDDGMWVIHAIIANAQEQEVEAATEASKNVSAETLLEKTPAESTFDKKRVDALTIMAEHYLATAVDGLL